jgi:hypothetical protein
MYVCMYVCMHACMYICTSMHVCMYICMYVSNLVCRPAYTKENLNRGKGNNFATNSDELYCTVQRLYSYADRPNKYSEHLILASVRISSLISPNFRLRLLK